MNVIVANKYTSLFNGSNIQIMKAVTGVYKVSEIVNYFKGMYYQKLIIDATALADFPKQEVLRELASRFDTEKIILFLPPDDPPPASFLSFLVSISIYNFTDNIIILKIITTIRQTLIIFLIISNQKHAVLVGNPRKQLPCI